MIEIFMNLIFTDRVFNVIIFDLFRPTIVKMVNFAGYLSTVFKIISFVDLGVPAFPKDTQNEVSVL